MTAEWIDSAPATMAGADTPFHSGVTVDLILGNILRVHEQSAYDLQCYHHKDTELNYTFSVSEVWRDMSTEWRGWWVPMRKNTDGSWRSIQISIEGKVGTGGVNSWVEVHLKPVYQNPQGVDDTDGLGAAAENFGTLIFSTSDWAVLTTTISLADHDVNHNDDVWEWSGDTPLTPIDEVVCQLIAKSSTTDDLSLRAPRFKEVTT
jgi:hypothetical protein